MKEITVQELKAKLDANEDFQLIDVREQKEFDFVNINGELIPLGSVMNNLDKFSKDKEVIVMCRSGIRSGQVVDALKAKGFNNLANLKGGILAWAREIDTTLPTY
jgi:adenylyltransferase/sulfurtransferase